VRREPAFTALLQEAVAAMLAGEPATGEALARDQDNGTASRRPAAPPARRE
jgi:hypothetical protein